jgi:hypothetical protein
MEFDFILYKIKLYVLCLRFLCLSWQGTRWTCYDPANRVIFFYWFRLECTWKRRDMIWDMLVVWVTKPWWWIFEFCCSFHCNYYNRPFWCSKIITHFYLIITTSKRRFPFLLEEVDPPDQLHNRHYSYYSIKHMVLFYHYHKCSYDILNMLII